MVKYFCDFCGKETKSTFEYLLLDIRMNHEVFIDEEAKTISYQKYKLCQDKKIHICMNCAKTIMEVQDQLSKKE